MFGVDLVGMKVQLNFLQRTFYLATLMLEGVDRTVTGLFWTVPFKKIKSISMPS